MNLYDLAPEYIHSIAPYQPGKPISELAREMGLDEHSIIKLASNENPFGTSPLALEAMAKALKEVMRYPDGNGFELKTALSKKYAVDSDQIMLGNGSNDVLELAAYATTLSSRTDGDPRTLSWLVDETLEVPLGWYMRDFEQVSYVPNVQNAPDVGGVIAPVGAAAPERFVGLRFRVHSEPSGTEYPAVDWMRWWTGHKSNIESSVSGEDVMLWIMSAQ